MVVRSETTTMIHLSEIRSIVADTTAIYFSAYLLNELAKTKIPVLFCDEQHNPSGQYLPLYGAHNTSKKISEQVKWDKHLADELWAFIIKDKITKQADVLSDRKIDTAAMLYVYASDVQPGDPSNREGHAAKVYFNSLFGNDFSRDKDIATNACLNYGYAVILSSFNKEIVSRGYLTQLGINHHNEFNQFNLSCDLMEPFRPFVDRFVADWEYDVFNDTVRIELANLINEEVFYRDGKYKLSSVIALFVKDCIDVMDKIKPIGDMDTYKWQKG
jgi:CRISPR-associated protein Cas1